MADVRKAFEEATEIDPDFSSAWYYRAWLEERIGNRGLAAGYYARALEALPDFPEAMAAQARHRILSGNHEAAATLADRVLELVPDDGDAVLIRCVAVRVTADGRRTLAFPEPTDARGRRLRPVRPLDDVARLAIENEVFRSLDEQGVVL